ncbi:MAG: endonuclease/exonuclease/phosphatase family protein [Phormidesmis sp.]
MKDMKRFSSIVSAGCAWLALGITAVAVLSSRISGPLLFEILCHFQVQYFGVVFFLSAIAIWLKRSRLTFLTLFCLALLFAQVIPWYFPPAQSGMAPDYRPDYRVMSTNLNIANSNAAEVIKLTETEQPDLALFIEVNDSMAQQLETLKTFLPYSSNQLTPYQPRTVLYSKDPIIDLEIRKFDTNNAVNLTAHIQTKNQRLSIVAIHPLPPLNREFLNSRNKVFRAVSDYVQPQTDPVVLIGDFNTTMWSPSYRMLAHKTGLKNTRKGLGILPTWPANTSYLPIPKLGILTKPFQIPIDQCLASPSLRALSMHTGPDVGSDHLPIIVDFLISKESQ